MSPGSNHIAPGHSTIPPETLKAALELWGQAGEAHFIPLRGTSMLPLLREGDWVLVDHSSRNIKQGDIVVLQNADGLITHRVLRVENRGSSCTLRTKGDNILALDPAQPKDALVGRVVMVRRDDRGLNLDTPLWRGSGRIVAVIMLAQAWVYHKVGNNRGFRPVRSYTKLARLLSIMILRSNALLLRIFLAVFGRWQD